MSEGPQIRFDDGIHAVVSNSGGVYNLRERSRTGTGSIRAQSLTGQSSKEYDLEREVSNVEERDIHKKQVRSSSSCSWLAFANALQVFSGWHLYWYAVPFLSYKHNF
jgi:hypothetical protein